MQSPRPQKRPSPSPESTPPLGAMNSRNQRNGVGSGMERQKRSAVSDRSIRVEEAFAKIVVLKQSSKISAIFFLKEDCF
jgi:hypothetical protein